MFHPYLDTEVEEDLMDMIDPEGDYAVETLVLAGRILGLAIHHNGDMDDAEYERTLVRSVEMAEGEWSIG